MPINPVTVAAITGSTLIALLLNGSARYSATAHNSGRTSALTRSRSLFERGRQLYSAGKFAEARGVFLESARFEQSTGLLHEAAMDWSNAGATAMLLGQYEPARSNYAEARRIAEAAGDGAALAAALNNQAELASRTGRYEEAASIAREALSGPARKAGIGVRPKILYQLANAYMRLHRPDSAEPLFREAIDGMVDGGDVLSAARALTVLGRSLIAAGKLPEAEQAMNEAWRLVSIHRLDAEAGTLSGLAALRSAQGREKDAAGLFHAALEARPGLQPRWTILAARARHRLYGGDVQGALADFREARGMAMRLRADMVPADQDRVAFEDGLGEMFEGLVDAGNRIALETGDKGVLRETFDAAEEDRLWSLRALIPDANDWRKRLPEHYWELLGRYQATEAALAVKRTPELEKKVHSIGAELRQAELEAGDPGGGRSREGGEKPLARVQRLLDEKTVLLSFHVSSTSAWVWAVDRDGLDVYRLPPLASIREKADRFSEAIRRGLPSGGLGLELYRDLFGEVAPGYLKRPRWLLELDSTLYSLPFAALVVEERKGTPVYLTERAELQPVPGALLLERGAVPAGGAFLGVGDPIYNPADPRYQGARRAPGFMLARLPNTADEIAACSRAWNPENSRLLSGAAAESEEVARALAANPAIIHFATHVVTSPGDYRSGMIALSLDAKDGMGLLGPKEIVARPVSASLVTINGCHSARADALPGAGLMGLTRAWIGAGAKSVLATQWDIPDSAAQSLAADFYAALRAAPEQGAAAALRQAQLIALRSGTERAVPGNWSGYFLLSRLL